MLSVVALSDNKMLLVLSNVDTLWLAQTSNKFNFDALIILQKCWLFFELDSWHMNPPILLAKWAGCLLYVVNGLAYTSADCLDWQGRGGVVVWALSGLFVIEMIHMIIPIKLFFVVIPII